MTTNSYTFNLPNGESRTIKQSPNQRLIEIHLVCQDGHNGINFDQHIKARTNLSKNAFELYDFLEFLPSGLIWSMSSKKLYEETALTEQTYAKAFKELIDKFYLREGKILTMTTENGKRKSLTLEENTYHFYEDPTMNPKNPDYKKN